MVYISYDTSKDKFRKSLTQNSIGFTVASRYIYHYKPLYLLKIVALHELVREYNVQPQQPPCSSELLE